MLLHVISTQQTASEPDQDNKEVKMSALQGSKRQTNSHLTLSQLYQLIFLHQNIKFRCFVFFTALYTALGVMRARKLLLESPARS